MIFQPKKKKREKKKKKKKQTWDNIKKLEKETMCHIGIKVGWFYFFLKNFSRKVT